MKFFLEWSIFPWNLVYSGMNKGLPLFPEDYLTDQTERTLAAEYVREKLLHLTSQELWASTSVAQFGTRAGSRTAGSGAGRSGSETGARRSAPSRSSTPRPAIPTRRNARIPGTFGGLVDRWMERVRLDQRGVPPAAEAVVS